MERFPGVFSGTRKRNRLSTKWAPISRSFLINKITIGGGDRKEIFNLILTKGEITTRVKTITRVEILTRVKITTKGRITTGDHPHGKTVTATQAVGNSRISIRVIQHMLPITGIANKICGTRRLQQPQDSNGTGTKRDPTTTTTYEAITARTPTIGVLPLERALYELKTTLITDTADSPVAYLEHRIDVLQQNWDLLQRSGTTPSNGNQLNWIGVSTVPQVTPMGNNLHTDETDIVAEMGLIGV